MNVIVPAILPTSREDLEDKLLRLQGISEEVQIDLVDGKFASPAAWPFIHGTGMLESEDVETLGFLGSLRVEVDLMVSDAEAQIRTWTNAGANRIVIHVEAALMLHTLLADVETQFGHDKDFAPDLLSVGLAVHANTDTSVLEPFLGQIDFVQFMGIRSVGKQGEMFDSAVLPKIRAFKKKFPGIPLQVDGGVSIETAPELLSAGVSRLIIGSALWKSQDIAATYQQFVELSSHYGAYN